MSTKYLDSIPCKNETFIQCHEKETITEKKRICAPSFIDNNVKKYVVYAFMHIPFHRSFHEM